MLVAEAGHVSHSLVLAATALGLHARPFGGVFDSLDQSGAGAGRGAGAVPVGGGGGTMRSRAGFTLLEVMIAPRAHERGRADGICLGEGHRGRERHTGRRASGGADRPRHSRDCSSTCCTTCGRSASAATPRSRCAATRSSSRLPAPRPSIRTTTGTSRSTPGAPVSRSTRWPSAAARPAHSARASRHQAMGGACTAAPCDRVEGHVDPAPVLPAAVAITLWNQEEQGASRSPSSCRRPPHPGGSRLHGASERVSRRAARDGVGAARGARGARHHQHGRRRVSPAVPGGPPHLRALAGVVGGCRIRDRRHGAGEARPSGDASRRDRGAAWWLAPRDRDGASGGLASGSSRSR